MHSGVFMFLDKNEFETIIYTYFYFKLNIRLYVNNQILFYHEKDNNV